MTLEEKAGLMFHTMIPMNDDGTLLEGMRHVRQPFSTAEMVDASVDEPLQCAARLPAPVRWPSGTTGCRRWPRRRGWASR